MSDVSSWRTLARHAPLGILADLDGTLIPFAPRPEEATVGPEVRAALAVLAALPDTVIAVVSGRRREDLDRWLGDIPGLALVAEHGAWQRAEGAWRPAPVTGDLTPPDDLAQELAALAEGHPGAVVEHKTWSTCLHYRGVRPDDQDALLIAAQAAATRWVQTRPGYEVLEANLALEVRALGARKSLAVEWIRQRAGHGVRLLVLGDDITDEDMFRVCGLSDEPVIVGPIRARSTAARWRLDGPSAAMAFLNWLVRARRDAPTPQALVLPTPLIRGARAAPVRQGELLVVSNRLPDLRTPVDPESARIRNVGGLVSAIQPLLARRRGLWLGWNGRACAGTEATPVTVEREGAPALAWLELPEAVHTKYYNGFCNRGLWPLFHLLPGRARFVDDEWLAYRRVNAMFAAAARELVGADDPIWLHDYHLYGVADELRRNGHRGPLGHFLHIPFPPADLFATIPWGAELLDAMLSFDLLGFHTRRYMENFLDTVGLLSPARVGDDVVEHRGRRVRVGVFPLGVMPTPPDEVATEGRGDLGGLLDGLEPTQLILGVDRLDYTKGIPERLEAFGRLLECHPEWRGHVSFVQISVPSRADVPEYVEQRARVESLVGHINGIYGETHHVPVRYLYRSYERRELTQLYRAADVAMVTPLRDGMNLVAKEFVAAQDPARPGVLLLSRFAGAADELHDALLTNPWHIDGMAEDLHRALGMPLSERRQRHAKLAATVARTTALSWAEDFLDALEACRRRVG